MRLRHLPVVLAVAALVPVALATPAHALTCPMLVDPAHDTRILTLPLDDPQTDILSADVASGPTTVVAVLRTSSLADNLFSQLGVSWAVAWDVGSSSYAASLRRGAGPNPVYTAVFTSPSGTSTPTWSYDIGNATITWTIPRSALPGVVAGDTYSGLRTFTTVFGSTSDQATSSATYQDQAPGCVPAA